MNGKITTIRLSLHFPRKKYFNVIKYEVLTIFVFMTLSAHFICFFAIILTTLGYSPELNAQQTISTTRVKGQKGAFKSTELDQLFGVKDRTYSFPGLKDQELKQHRMKLVKMHPADFKDERSLLLLLDENNNWTDTLSLGYLENISFSVVLEGNRTGICTGDFNFGEMQFYIERIFEVTSQSKLVAVDKNTRIIDCPPVFEEGRSKKETVAMQAVFHYTVVPSTPAGNSATLSTQIAGEWRITCHNNLTILDISTDKTVYLSLDGATYITGELTEDPLDSSAFLIAFSSFYLPSDAVRNDYERNLARIASIIDRDQAIAKVSLLPENKLWLEWYGLFDTEISEYRFPLTELVFYTENNRERPIVLKRCL